MPTLAQRLPYLHPFAGGFPYRGSQRLPSDPDALTYLAAVAAADGAPVEVGVAMAVDDFFKGTKADGTFSALKAACLLCGARTLAGALVPLAGDAPTNNNFVDADYNRETGLAGDASTKYLDSGRAGNADPQDDRHWAIYSTTALSNGDCSFGLDESGAFGNSQFRNGINNYLSCSSPDTAGASNALFSNSGAAGFHGASRSNSASFVARSAGAVITKTVSSGSPPSDNAFVFARNLVGTGANLHASTRLAFYSIGEALDLASLDARVSALIQRIQLSLSTGLDASGYDDATVAYLLAAYNNGATLA